MSVIYSFFQLISKCRIEIPIIQRDYAQGRVNSKAKDVRKTIVSDLIKAVKGKKALFFDFVYGRLDNYKFIPFDGQQRLTTLFLFHKYVFERCQRISNCEHKDSCICKEILKNFTYATRQSSREFCREMVENDIIPIQRNEKVSNHVINQSWFYSDWKKDPTIMGMLEMFDEIHFQFENTKVYNEDYKSFAEKLTSGCNCPITFYFVDMGGNRLPDETYVKMNVRGKTLTPFENFKASLEQYLHETNKIELTDKNELIDRFNSNIDGKWLDLFWNVINEGKDEKELPDSAIMRFFNRHFMNVWRCWFAQNSKSEAEDEIEEYETFNKRIIHEMPLYPSKDDFVSWDIYQYILDKCGVNECLNPLFNIWDNFCEENNIRKDCQAVWNRKDGEIRWNLFEGERRNSDNRETYPSRVAFYALLKYFGEAKYSSLTLSQWMRVVWNIIENSTIDSSEPYHAALRLINKLSTNCSTIYDALANHFEGFGLGTQYHAKEQVEEEKDKAKQILHGSLHTEENIREKIIIDAESFAFFKGAIRFLFTNENGEDGWCDFEKKLGNAKKYFEKSGVKEDFKIQLTKALTIQCNNWDAQLYNKQIFNPNANTWKWILCSSIWNAPIHTILIIDNLNNITPTETLGNEGANNSILSKLATLPYDYFVKKEPNGRFRWNGKLGYYRPYGQEAITFDWGDFHRNELLNKLVDDVDKRVYIDPEIKVPDSYFRGWNIPFKFQYESQQFDFQWDANGNVYLVENGLYKLRKEDQKEYYCFNSEGIADTNIFIIEIEKLIKLRLSCE